MSRDAANMMTSLALSDARVTDVARSLRDLDPDARYEVLIRQKRKPGDVFASMDRLSIEVSARAKAAGLTPEELAETLGMDEEERRALLNQS